MADVRSRLLVWHKLIAQVTGGMSLAYGKSGLKKSEAVGWVEVMRNVAADIEHILEGREPVLDLKTMKVVSLSTSPPSGANASRSDTAEQPHEVTPSVAPGGRVESATRGPRVATRKK